MLEFFNFLEVVNENVTVCGGLAIPNELFNMTALIIRGFKIVVPILLIIWGMLDFAKSIIAKKEEDIKKFRSAFVGRLISAILVFVIIVVVQLAVNLIDGVEKQSASGETIGDVWSCSKKFISGVEAGNNVDVNENENNNGITTNEETTA